MFSIVILAGGLATRLRPLTETIPKSLVEVNGVPFILHQLKLLKSQGIHHVVMCVGYLGEMLQNFLGDGSQLGLKIDYSFDGEKLLGTAGAIKKALPLLTDHFFVLYGDSYLPCDYHAIQNAYIEKNRNALMTVFKNQGKWDTSNVEFYENNIIAYDKIKRTDRMFYIDYGLGVLNKNAFEHIHENETYDLANLYKNLLAQHQLSGYEVHERFYEIGSFNGIEELTHYLKNIPGPVLL